MKVPIITECSSNFTISSNEMEKNARKSSRLALAAFQANSAFLFFGWFCMSLDTYVTHIYIWETWYDGRKSLLGSYHRLKCCASLTWASFLFILFHALFSEVLTTLSRISFPSIGSVHLPKPLSPNPPPPLYLPRLAVVIIYNHQDLHYTLLFVATCDMFSVDKDRGYKAPRSAFDRSQEASSAALKVTDCRAFFPHECWPIATTYGENLLKPANDKEFRKFCVTWVVENMQGLPWWRYSKTNKRRVRTCVVSCASGVWFWVVPQTDDLTDLTRAGRTTGIPRRGDGGSL